MGDKDADKKRDLTRLLAAWRAGREGALDELLAAVYDELRRMARTQLRRDRHHHTLQPTELVHEAVHRLLPQRVNWQNRDHFFAIVVTCMRRVLADYGRRRRAQKRPQIDGRVAVADVERSFDPKFLEAIAVAEMIERLAKVNRRAAQVAELRLLGGLNNSEIAELLNVSLSTVKRDWDAAQEFFMKLLAEAK